jgi:hypothetical protein
MHTRHNRITVATCLAALFLAGSVLAVEKVVKKKTPEPPKKTTQPAKPTPPAKPAAPPTKKADPPKKKFDDFIDKNNNGVDDRKEKPRK